MFKKSNVYEFFFANVNVYVYGILYVHQQYEVGHATPNHVGF